jgi:hypothetical protein
MVLFIKYYNKGTYSCVLKQVPINLFYFMTSQSYEVDEKLMEAFHKALGERIKQLRKEKGYKNHETFAYEHGFARAQFGNYERGAGINFSSIVKVAAAMNLTLAELFSEGFEQFDQLKTLSGKSNR